jgi:hypothetical protein
VTRARGCRQRRKDQSGAVLAEGHLLAVIGNTFHEQRPDERNGNVADVAADAVLPHQNDTAAIA